MKPTEGLDQLVRHELFPADEVGGLIAFVEAVDAQVRRGALTEADADLLLDAHAERMILDRERAVGRPPSRDERELAGMILLALNADGTES